MTKIPEFRVRVFLSVDLSGSTEYKSKSKDASWIRTFRKFYSQFLQYFRRNYTAFCEGYPECNTYRDQYPKLWKTIGDEAIFVNRVGSLFQLFAYVHAFDLSLKEYRDTLKSLDDTEKLDVKGNGWIAAFPHPNQTIPRPNPEIETEEETMPDEKIEKLADETPSDFDFLGPGVDAGFRISKNSAPDMMTLSPVLACLLAHANNNHIHKKFAFRFRFSGTNILKGVVEGKEYPIVGINTEHDKNRAKIIELRDRLTGANELLPKDLIEYLECFLELNQIDMPAFETSETGFCFVAPESYQKTFIPYWQDLQVEMENANKNKEESEAATTDTTSKNGNDEYEKLSELIDELTKKLSDGLEF